MAVPTPAEDSAAFGPNSNASRAICATVGRNGAVRFVSNSFPPFVSQSWKVNSRVGELVGLAEGPGLGLVADPDGEGEAAEGPGPSDPALPEAHAAASSPDRATAAVRLARRFIIFLLSRMDSEPHGPPRPQQPHLL